MQTVSIVSLVWSTIAMMVLLSVICIFLSVIEKKHPFQQTLPKVPNWLGRAISSYAFRLILVVVISYWYYSNEILKNVHIFNLGNYAAPFIGGIIGYFIDTFFDYWTHRFRHNNYKLWLGVHQFHHSPSRLQTITSFYKHPLENIVEVIITSIISITLLGLDPIGAAWVQFWVILVNMIYHTNIKTPRWLGYFVQRPEMHLIHHARNVQYFNFADLPIWDILFGTFRNPEPAYPGPCGFRDLAELRIGPMLQFKEVDPDRVEKTFQGDISGYLKAHDFSEAAPPQQKSVGDLNTAVLVYIEHGVKGLTRSINKLNMDKGFFTIPEKSKMEQINFLTDMVKKFEELAKKVKNSENAISLEVLDQFFSGIITETFVSRKDNTDWYETIEEVKKQLRGFISDIAAQFSTVFNQYAESWKILAKEYDLPIINVQLNVIGLLNSVEVYNADSAKQYLDNLNQVDWDSVFEIVFSKKAIRDRLFKIANIFVEHAGSIDKLNSYLTNQLNSDDAITSLFKVYQSYLAGIGRKMDLFRISYPEFTFEAGSHPLHADVLAAQERAKFISNFLANLTSTVH